PAAEKRRHVRRLGVRRADVEHAVARPDARQRPRDLDQALVGSRRRLEEPALARGSKRLVEREEALELFARDELAEQGRARDLALERSRLRLAAEDEAVRAADELLVGELGELEVRQEA